MEINDIDMDVDTDSEFDSDEDALLEAENMKRLNALLEEEDDAALTETMSQRLSDLPSVHPAPVVRPCSSNPTSDDTQSRALAQIDVALSANKILDEKMRRLERDLGLRLRECREKLQVIQNSGGGHGEKKEIFRYINCGRPYFKDRLNFPAPDNEDAKMAKSQMYDFSLVISVPGWTVRDKSQFINMVHKMSIDNRKNALHAKITNLKRRSKSNRSKVEEEITAIRNEIDQVSSLPFSQIALPIDEEYDWDMLANKLNRRHTAQEYQSLWKLFFHPSINKNSWSKSEHAALQKIACQNRQQDWDDIARKLNTGRTGYQCFVYYRTNMINSFTGKKWTSEEITYLKRLIDYFKEDMYIPWGKIAAAMENRTKIQIYNKYLRIIEQRKGRFLPEEDAVILNCVERFGTNFRKMTNYLPGRSMVQIRTRYQVLSKMRVSTVWTVEDDKRLIQIMTNQDANMNFSTATQYFPGRNRTKLRTRYMTLMKWMKKHPTLDLEHAPRRDTDSEFDSDEDALLEAENMKRLNALLEEEDDAALTETMSQRLSDLPSVHPAPVVRPCSSNPTSDDTQSRALAQIDVALSANKILDEKMRRLERDLGLRLRECREKLQVIQNSGGGHGEKKEIFRYINCGRPYFKDRLNFPAPDNEDAKMAKSQMYDFSLVISVPGWTVRDKSQFINMVHKMSIDNRKNALHAKITNLKRRSKSNRSKVEEEITAIRNEIDQVSSLPFSQIALPIDEEYDWDMLANKLNRRHTAQEYQSLWKLFFHPSINKNSWSKSEHAALQKIACQNRQQDWDDIARKLNTGRTGYQCFVYYRTNMINSFTGKKWTSEEITYLKRLIDYFKEDMYIPWGKIAAAMENRTKIQIYNKYLRIIEQRKGRFLPEEDAVILNCVERFGTNFRKMTNYLPGRSMVQIRTRYQVLSKMRVSTVWTVEDDKRLIQIMTNQDANMNFSTATQYFPGRNRTKLRTRYMTLMKWMKKHPTLDLEHAPRRGARRLNHGFASDNLNDAIENLKNTLNTEVEIKSKKKKINTVSPHVELDDALTVVLVNELVREKETEMKMQNAPENQIYLGPNHFVTYAELNTTNLRKTLLFLNACLDQTRYNNSKYRHLYPNLGDSDQDVSLVRVKSYSRKNSVKTIKVDDTPNVWGRPILNTIGQRNYVLPPHLQSISGCRGLLHHVTTTSQYCESINLHVLVRRNLVMKELLDQVLERFYTLFTWPMILSNEGPCDHYEPKFRTDSVFVRPPKLPNPPAVTINTKCIKKYKNVDHAEVIDLNEEQTKDNVTVAEKLESSDEKIEKLFTHD
uniref:snRNA-activating protein complex subunit 4 n=1 Tax=Heliothis virescens TaxID=7102 RepID=A0A2A4J723_HELVI